MKSILTSTAALLAIGSMPDAAAMDQPSAVGEQPAVDGDTQVDPALVAERVEQALEREDDLSAARVSVTTHARTIVITGNVSSKVEAARVAAVANEVAGGMRVESRVEVRPEQIEASQRQSLNRLRAVERALREDPRTADLGVAVSIDEEQVIGLHGLLPSAQSRRLVEEVAGRAAGSAPLRVHLVVPGE